MFGEKEFQQYGFPTPESTPDETACRIFLIPASTTWLAVFMGAIDQLANPLNWQQLEGGMSREDAAAVAQAVIDDAYAQAETGVCEVSVPAPYWDDENDADDEMLVSEQTWYGFTSGSFVEDMADWVLTGFIAASTNLHAAILYKTYVPRMRLAFRRGDWGGLIRVTVNGIEALRVNTANDVEDIISVPLIIQASGGVLDDEAEIIIERITA